MKKVEIHLSLMSRIALGIIQWKCAYDWKDRYKAVKRIFFPPKSESKLKALFG